MTQQAIQILLEWAKGQSIAQQQWVAVELEKELKEKEFDANTMREFIEKFDK